MQEVYLCLDVGGTEIKAAPLDKRGNFLAPVRHFPAMAGADRQTLLENFGWIFSSICPENAVPIEIDLAFPGPFDYKNGICLLQGLDKYDALYGCNLRRAFSEISGLPEQRIQFINDAAAFALGEMTFGQATQAGRALFVAVGTGCGSAFGVNGFLAEEGTPGVPPNGYFYNAPFRDSCVDDYISRRGLEKLSGEMLGVPLDGRALAERIAAGDERAKACFRCFGEQLCDALQPQIEAFCPDTLCMGGQIMASAALFLHPLEKLCTNKKIDSTLYEAATLDGATKWQQTKYITLPALKPIIVMMFILNVGHIFYSDFGLFYQVTQGIPNSLYNVASTFDTYVYQALQSNVTIGRTAAAGLFQAACCCATVLVANFIVSKIDEESAII